MSLQKFRLDLNICRRQFLFETPEARTALQRTYEAQIWNREEEHLGKQEKHQLVMANKMLQIAFDHNVAIGSPALRETSNIAIGVEIGCGPNPMLVPLRVYTGSRIESFTHIEVLCFLAIVNFRE